MRAEERINPSAEPGCVAEYAVWLDEETVGVRIEPKGPSCPYAYRQAPLDEVLLEAQASLEDGFREVDEIMIGEVLYTLLTHSDHADPGLSDTYFTFGLDVGLLDLFNVFSLAGSGQITYTTYRLLYAEVGGMVYGSMPVASEDDSAPVAFALSAAYPNPFRSTATLTLSLPTAEAATLEAFDVHGRRVLLRDLGMQPTGASSHTIGGAALVPGVYFVRATTASGQSATQRLVRVE